jgi:hypothetical protein
MLETGLSVGLEIVFFTNPSFTSGYWLTWPSILCRIGGFVGFGGLLATAPPEALGSIGLPITSCMIFVSATSALVKCALLIFDASQCVSHGIAPDQKSIAVTNHATLRCHKLESDRHLGRSWTLRANRKNGFSCDPEVAKHPPPGVDSEQRTSIPSNWQCRAAQRPDGKHCQPPSNHR